MEKKGTRLFQQATNSHEQGWNIVELESRRQLRRKVNELIQFASSSSMNASEIQQQLRLCITLFGTPFITHLVRSLQRDDSHERQSIVWLLALLNDKAAILPLQHIAHNECLPRSIRLSASLALAGMGATQEVTAEYGHRRLYAIS